jgi:hypothetical protein
MQAMAVSVVDREPNCLLQEIKIDRAQAFDANAEIIEIAVGIEDLPDPHVPLCESEGVQCGGYCV